MATEPPPNKKSRRIIEDEDDDSDELPDIRDPDFFNGPKATTPQATKEEDSDEGDEVGEGLFSDDEDASEKEETRSSSKKRYCGVPAVIDL